MPAAGGGLLQRSDGGGIADRGQDGDAVATEVLDPENRRRQRADLLRLVGEAEAEYDRLAANGIGEARVEVEFRAQPVQRLGVASVILQVALCQSLEHVDAGRSIRFGKDDVEAHGPHLVALEQLRRQPGELVARPGPASFALQAGLVDVDDDDLRVAAVRQRELQPRVVCNGLELGQQAGLAELRQRMQQEYRDDQQPDQPARCAGQPCGERAGCETHGPARGLAPRPPSQCRQSQRGDSSGKERGQARRQRRNRARGRLLGDDHAGVG